MEKEIYLTESPYYSELNETNHFVKDKKLDSIKNLRPQSGKLNSYKLYERFPPQNYYDDKKVKPGISIYKTIIDIEERRGNGQYQGPYLRMAIPEVVLLTENSDSMIYTDNNLVKVEFFSTNQSFLHRLDSTRPEYSVFPSVINSSSVGIFFNNTIMMNNQIVGSKIIPRSESFVCRKFVQPYNNTPNLLRLFYTSKNSKQLRKNYAYKMVNLKKMTEEMFKKKHRLTENYLIDSQKKHNFIGTIIKGKALLGCQQMAQSLIQYFQNGVNIKITEIVLDFIIDQNKQPWFQQVRSIKSKNLTKLWDIGTSNDIQLIAQKNNNSHFCNLCGMMYSRYQLQKIVTKKLIWQLIAHLQNRGVYFRQLPHPKQSGLTYVCNICYEVIVAEHKLINIQKQFSNLLNISPNTIERIMPKHAQSKSQPAILLQQNDFSGSEQIPRLKAWRLFFYIQKIKNYEKHQDRQNTDINLQIKFKNFKQYFSKTVVNQNHGLSKIFNSRYSSATRIKSARLQKHSVLFDKFRHNQRPPSSKMAKTNQTVTTLASKVSNTIANYFPSIKESYSIEKVKVYTLYTKKHQTTNIFANTQMEFFLTINDQKFYGKSLTLEELKNKDTCQRHSSQIFLFDERLKYCNLQLTVGLVCDGELMNDDLELEQIDGIYYPAKPFSMCKPLPDEWMEVFTKGEEVPTHSKQLSYEQIKQSHLRQESRLLQQLEITDLSL